MEGEGIIMQRWVIVLLILFSFATKVGSFGFFGFDDNWRLVSASDPTNYTVTDNSGEAFVVTDNGGENYIVR